MSKTAKKVGILAFGTFTAAVVLTLCPFFLPLSWRRVDAFLDWPMLLVDWRHADWLPRNAGNRVITLLLINVTGWALSLSVVCGAVIWARQKERARE